MPRDHEVDGRGVSPRTARADKQQQPLTHEEWQDAVDQAHFYLLIDAARAYGLITGGPSVNVDRCEEILQKGRQQGIKPRGWQLDDLLSEGT